MSQKIRLGQDEKIDDLSLDELFKRISELKEPKQKKAKAVKLTKAQKDKAAKDQKKLKKEIAELREQVEAELGTVACATDFNPNVHPYDQRSDKPNIKAMQEWVNTTYAEDLIRRTYGLSRYQLAVYDSKTKKIVLTSINPEKVFKALFDARYAERDEKKAHEEVLNKAMQEQP